MVEARFCPECGAPHAPDAHFCGACGHSFAVDGPPPGAGGTSAPPPPAAAPLPPTPPAVVPPPPPVAGAGAPPPPTFAPPGSPVAPVPPPSQGGNRTGLIAGIAILVVLLIAGGVGAFLLLGGDDDEQAEVFLEPVASTGQDPWTDSVDTHNATSSTTEPAIATTAPRTTVRTAATRSVGGAWPGLYGGTRNASSCNKEQLVTFLQANPAKARAWARVQGIQVADIPDYVAGLTPVILQRDTRVTNHGFRDGTATRIPAVLQAGTAVLVDEFGVPRVKCNCGNPLTEPTALTSTPRYTGERWPTFSPANVIRVTVDVQVTNFVLVDVKGGDPIVRPAGTEGQEDAEVTVDDLCDLYPDDPGCAGSGQPPGGTDEPELGTGDVQVTLRWGSAADLDLAVTDPTGATVDFETRTSSTGGSLDVDSNAACDGSTSSGVENVFWPEGQAPEGVYTATVTYFDACGGASGPQSFELTFKVAGSSVALQPASVQRGDDRTIATYQVELGRPSLLGPAGVQVQAVSDTLAEGERKSYKAEKTAQPAPEPEPEPEAPEPDPGEAPAPEPPDCSMYEEGTPMRILCEHQPGEAVGEGPIRVPGD